MDRALFCDEFWTGAVKIRFCFFVSLCAVAQFFCIGLPGEVDPALLVEPNWNPDRFEMRDKEGVFIWHDPILIAVKTCRTNHDVPLSNFLPVIGICAELETPLAEEAGAVDFRFGIAHNGTYTVIFHPLTAGQMISGRNFSEIWLSVETNQRFPSFVPAPPRHLFARLARLV
jgi:hypothetical protein